MMLYYARIEKFGMLTITSMIVAILLFIFGMGLTGAPICIAAGLFADLNLRDLMNRSLFDLSGGEKQKIACGSVAALFPEIIILDEPSSNLDWDSIRDLTEIMKIWKRQGKTVIISEHRLWYLKDIIDRAVYLEKGRIVREWDRDAEKGSADRVLLRNFYFTDTPKKYLLFKTKITPTVWHK